MNKTHVRALKMNKTHVRALKKPFTVRDRYFKYLHSKHVQIDLSDANLQYYCLNNVDLHGANLRGVNLSNSNLSDVNLKSADLSSANLCNANLHNANLASASLNSANLSDSCLYSANLDGADLRNVNLVGADLDFSSGIPLWCGGCSAKIDEAQAMQLLYHVFSMRCNSKRFIELKNRALEFCNEFWRVESGECRRIVKGK